MDMSLLPLYIRVHIPIILKVFETHTFQKLLVLCVCVFGGGVLGLGPLANVYCAKRGRTEILLTIFLKDGESTVESGSISWTTYSATSLLTSRGSSIAERGSVSFFSALILSLLSFGD